MKHRERIPRTNPRVEFLNLKSEILSRKSERTPKPEGRRPSRAVVRAFGIRKSGFFRASEFGIQVGGEMVGAVRFELTTFCTPSRRAYQATLRPDLIAQFCADRIIGRNRPNSTSFPVRFRDRFQRWRHRDTPTAARLDLNDKPRRVAGSARVEPGLPR